jgi:hypothetical protein
MTESLGSTGEDLVEVARAQDRLEAGIWRGQLEDQGIPVTVTRKGGWIRALLFLGRFTYAVSVPRESQTDAFSYLKSHRFI